jgi:hypothetical protein
MIDFLGSVGQQLRTDRLSDFAVSHKRDIVLLAGLFLVALSES